ncbi:unnamed protein product [Darwinula stevensoni]|uniref:Sugar transporter n=1 Tax=Darwinula stevensoni TaxID=69355 RepID=A0A7R9A508_9CRUS|nr:unnamed protein product [Darwinula stevensoni]CAG0894627.1 unnamed protein product [Darwinula stevensoni]
MMSTVSLALVLGGLVAAQIAKHWSRKWLLIALHFPIFASWLMITYPVNFSMFIVARVLGGFFLGIRDPIAQLYVAEIAHKDQRESPTFLLLHKRHEEAAAALRKLQGPHYDVTMEMDQVIKHIKESQETRSHFRDIFQWNYLKPVGLVALMMLFRQMTGIYVVLNFTVDIFEAAGEGFADSHVSTISAGAVQFVFLIISSLLMDRVGRKRLTIISSFLMAFAHFGFGLYYYFLDNELHLETLKSLYWVPIVTLCLFVAEFSLGMSSVVFVLLVIAQYKRSLTLLQPIHMLWQLSQLKRLSHMQNPAFLPFNSVEMYPSDKG